MKLLTVIGARPQFIKAAVVSRALTATSLGPTASEPIHEVLVHTGQHYDNGMSAVFFRELAIPKPAYHLEVGSGPHGQQTGRMLERLEPVMQRERPDCVVVYGDTNSTLAGALAASKLKIPVAHVEAGLRSYRPTMAEEINRVLTDHVSTFLFCPTAQAVKNLSCEGLLKGVHLVGDVMYDSLLYHLERVEPSSDLLSSLELRPREYALATIHRAETTDHPPILHRLFETLGRLELPVVVPLHPRTRAALQNQGVSLAGARVHVIEPVSYLEMLTLAQKARLILTDSGGLQKEAFWLRVPCVTLRDETEWLETVETGWNRLAGTEPEPVLAACRMALHAVPQDQGRPYGDGHAAERLLQIVGSSLGVCGVTRP
jgi:UDP-N-acetylglucosamine 2-epimerase